MTDLVARLRSWNGNSFGPYRSPVPDLLEAADELEGWQALPVEIENVARWLENGCDVQQAARELRLIAQRQQAGRAKGAAVVELPTPEPRDG